MAAPLIRTSDLAKAYRTGDHTVHALRGISVTIEAGEFVAVMGPSGSGKTTFLNLLGCLARPTGGRYLLDGTDVSARSDDELASIRKCQIGFVFQTFNLLARTAAWENVELPLLYTDMAAAERRRRASAMLASLGLGDRRDHQPSQLSGGEQQRVAIARALVNEPSVVLADEPTGSLEERTGLEIMALFQELNRDGLTIVMVTHNPEVAHHARRILTFRDGHLVDDSPVPAPLDPIQALAGLTSVGDTAPGPAPPVAP